MLSLQYELTNQVLSHLFFYTMSITIHNLYPTRIIRFNTFELMFSCTDNNTDVIRTKTQSTIV